MKNIENQKKITILSQYFYPDTAATGQLLTELAEDMAKFKFNIKVFCGLNDNGNREKLRKKEIYKNIKIRRVSFFNTSKNKKSGRIIGSIAFVKFIFFRILFEDKQRLLFIVTNPPFLMVVGYIMKLLFKQKYVILVHDIYPEIAEVLGYIKCRGFIARIWRFMNKKIYQKADSIIVLSEDMKNQLKNTYKKIEHKISVIPNWADENLIFPVPRKDNWFYKNNNFENKFILMYSGNLGLFQDLESIVEAVWFSKNKNLLLVFIGDGGKKPVLQKMATERKLENIIFLNYLDKKDLAYSLSSADISFISLEKNVEELCMPSKLYSIMASGRPVIAITNEKSEIAQIIKKSECGFAIKQYDIKSIVDKIEYLYNNPKIKEKLGKNARIFFEKHFKRSIITRKYLRLLSKIL
ncbi:MAG: glycosyltransferase family 4 protein [Spirochaetia bacterium]|nr:glycosyltransferase family 4 protein [Spirochaetia bacterium]